MGIMQALPTLGGGECEESESRRRGRGPRENRGEQGKGRERTVTLTKPNPRKTTGHRRNGVYRFLRIRQGK